jgi:hypothetical protein
VAVLTGEGVKAENDARFGGGLLALAAVLSGDGTKAAAGGATVTLLAALMGDGKGTGTVAPPIVYYPPIRWRRPMQAPVRQAFGGGTLRLYAVLTGGGTKTFESDDELVLALAA